jgi:hypothetical protein
MADANTFALCFREWLQPLQMTVSVYLIDPPGAGNARQLPKEKDGGFRRIVGELLRRH